MSHMCINNIIFSKPNTYLVLFLSISTYIHNFIIYASLACISAATMSPIESFADLKGYRFRFHLQALLCLCVVFRWQPSIVSDSLLHLASSLSPNVRTDVKLTQTIQLPWQHAYKLARELRIVSHKFDYFNCLICKYIYASNNEHRPLGNLFHDLLH